MICSTWSSRYLGTPHSSLSFQMSEWGSSLCDLYVWLKSDISSFWGLNSLWRKFLVLATVLAHTEASRNYLELIALGSAIFYAEGVPMIGGRRIVNNFHLAQLLSRRLSCFRRLLLTVSYLGILICDWKLVMTVSEACLSHFWHQWQSQNGLEVISQRPCLCSKLPWIPDLFNQRCRVSWKGGDHRDEADVVSWPAFFWPLGSPMECLSASDTFNTGRILFIHRSRQNFAVPLHIRSWKILY